MDTEKLHLVLSSLQFEFIEKQGDDQSFNLVAVLENKGRHSNPASAVPRFTDLGTTWITIDGKYTNGVCQVKASLFIRRVLTDAELQLGVGFLTQLAAAMGWDQNTSSSDAA